LNNQDQIRNFPRKKFNFDEEPEDNDEVLLNQKFETFNASPLSQTKIDWSNVMNSPTNQGVCGSCWAFATIGAIEGNYNLKLGNSKSFSQQQLVDCSSANNACNGGYPSKALEYIKNNGISFYNDYPYFSGITNFSKINFN